MRINIILLFVATNLSALALALALPNLKPSTITETQLPNERWLQPGTNKFQIHQELFRRLEEPRNEVVVRDLWEHLYQELKSFVNDTYFDYHSFGLRKEFLKLCSLDYSIFAERLPNINETLASQMKFVKYLLSIMSIVYDNARRPISNNLNYDEMLLAAGFLRLKVLMLFNSRGLPNHNIQGLMAKVLVLSAELRNLEHNFRGCPSIPLGIRMITWEHIIQASKTLERMRNGNL